MPTTPQVNFNFKNENVQASVPQLGISHFLARTTKGPFNDPSLVLTSYPQFQRVFGEEVVPDGTISNIKKAFAMGSKIRVSRVAGSAHSYGNATNIGGDTQPEFTFTTPGGDVKFKVRTKEEGSKIEGKDKIYFSFAKTTQGTKTVITLNQYLEADTQEGKVVDDSLFASTPFIAWGNGYIDWKMLQNFIATVPNIVIDLTSWGYGKDIYSVVQYLSLHPEGDITNDTSLTSSAYELDKGNDGGVSTADTWKEAYMAIAEYNDAYAIYLSHVHQHLPDDYQKVYKGIADLVKVAYEAKLMVELPKPIEGTSLENYLKALLTLISTVGQHKLICYYGGGIKYYDEMGVIRDCDVMGTVAGLADTCASQFGPWYSPAGPNRGLVFDALGPVMKNLGGSAMLPELQKFADLYMNLFVIKDTQYAGKRTMLWHNFTSNPISDSEKFISIVNLNLYLKKNLRPIIESEIENPNTFSTWKNIWYKVKPILEDLVNRNAMIDPQWLGDQNATKYEDLQINNEADVRQGKYRVKLTYKDIVTLQEVTLDIIITQADQSISITSNE